MRQKLIGSALLVALALLPASASAETMFWLDTPPNGATVAGVVEVAGWILDDRGVSNIDLYVDGVFVAPADLNIPRYDVLQAYPWYAGTEIGRFPGFSVSFNAEALTGGSHLLFVRVRFSDGSTTDFGNRFVNVDKNLNQAPFGELERPGEFQPMGGVFPLTGWALDDGEVVDVEVLIDGKVLGYEVVTGISRPDIAHRFPSSVGADTAGFLLMLNTGELVNGVHVVAVRLRDDQGATRVIGRRFVQVFNTGANLVPFGRIDWPIRNHIMYAIGCREPPDISAPPYEDPRTVELISGWALDVGTSTDPGGVKSVELYINGTRLASSATDDFFYQPFDMDVNYYGHERPDIFRLFPDVPQAKDAGFAFALDVADLVVNKQYHQGLHYLSVRAIDILGHASFIDTIPVIFDCDDDRDRPSWGDIEEPPWMKRVSGEVWLRGWAIDYDNIRRVHVWVDGIRMSDPDTDPVTWALPTPDLRDQYPWYPFTYTRFAGWEYLLDTTRLSDGEHRIAIRTEDFFGGETWIGERLIVIDNLN